MHFVHLSPTYAPATARITKTACDDERVGGRIEAALGDRGVRRARRPDVWTTMSEGRGDYETIFCSNGWIEIRNQKETDDQWIASDTPVSIER